MRAEDAAVAIGKIRNVAIVAHVDHGKTTLVDSMLRHGGQIVNNTRLLDQGDLEKEKGITILAKATRLKYKDYIVNIVDTPGHADFGGEVERVLSIVDTVVLVIDYCTGPMPQSKFVLGKALLNPDLVPIVVANKVDRAEGRHEEGLFENEVFELFVSLDANDAQMEYPILYGSAKQGWMERSLAECKKAEHPVGIQPLLDLIISHTPSPTPYTHSSFPAKDVSPVTQLQYSKNPISPDFTFLVSIVEKVPEIGYCLTGKVHSGFAMKDSGVFVLNPHDKSVTKNRIKEIYITEGITKAKIAVASAGDIVSLQMLGGSLPGVHYSLVATATVEPLPFRNVDPPVLSVDIGPNTSPRQGIDGKYGTLHDLTVRLQKEALVNLAIRVERSASGELLTICGRGDLQLSLIFETMRREGYEFEISPPAVLFTADEHGNRLEPYEKIRIVVPSIVSSRVLEFMMNRASEMVDTNIKGDFTEYIFYCSSRNFLGGPLFINDVSKGQGVITSEFIGHRLAIELKSPERSKQAFATAAGLATSFDLVKFQDHCSWFVEANDPVYEGMIVGMTSKNEDFYCNICKGRKLVVVTIARKDEFVHVLPSIRTSIEYCLNYIKDDELIEVTPKRVAMRKKILNNAERTRQSKKTSKVAA